MLSVLGVLGVSARVTAGSSWMRHKGSAAAKTAGATGFALFLLVGLLAAPPGSAADVSVSLAVGGDAYVNSNWPVKNYGSSRSLYVDGGPNQAFGFLAFDLGAVPGGTVVGATLRLATTSGTHAGSNGTVEVRGYGGQPWDEATVTFDSRPVLGDVVLGSVVGTARNQVQLVSLSPAGLQPLVGGVVTLSLSTSSRDGAFFWSSAVSDPLLRPELTVTTSDGTTTTTTTTLPPTTPPVVVVAAGDIACSPGEPVTPSTCQQQATSDLVLSLAPDAVLALGDLQYNSGAIEDFMASYHPTWGRFKAITQPVPGNHEYGRPGAWGYFDYFYPDADAAFRATGYYSYDLGEWHVVALNSRCEVVSCAAGSAQEQWLRADLAANAAACTLAYWHHPWFATGTVGVTPEVGPLVDALYDFGVDILLNGHRHNYERFAPMSPDGTLDLQRGLREFIVGTGGKEVLNIGIGGSYPNREARDTTSHGVLKLTLDSGSYAWDFVPVPGYPFTDSGSDACR